MTHLKCLVHLIFFTALWVAPCLAGEHECPTLNESLLTLGLSRDELDVFNSAGGSFFALKDQDPETISRLNRQAIDALNSESLSTQGSKKSHLSIEEIYDFFYSVEEDPLVRTSRAGSYRDSDYLGFCFGRAMITHLMALRLNLSKQSIRKVWAVGPMFNEINSKMWRYHVATLVRGPQGKWYAIDPIQSQPLTLENWHSRLLSSYKTEGKLRLFVTPASRFTPDHERKYSKEALLYEEYHGFFADVMNSVHRANTGRDGFWTRAAESERSRLLTRALVRKGLRAVAYAAPGLAIVLAPQVLIYIHDCIIEKKCEEKRTTK